MTDKRKIGVFLVLLFAAQVTHAQFKQASSFYFSEPQPISLPKVDTFDADFQGLYRLSSQKYIKLEVKKDSILSKNLTAFILTEKQIKENKDLYIENDLLYGVAPNGLYFMKENDTLLVALNQVEPYVDTKSFVVKRDENVYYVNQKVADNRWATRIFDFSKKGLIIYELDHDLAEKETAKMPKDVEYDGDTPVFIAAPTDKQFLSLAKSKGYKSEPITYKKD